MYIFTHSGGLVRTEERHSFASDPQQPSRSALAPTLALAVLVLYQFSLDSIHLWLHLSGASHHHTAVSRYVRYESKEERPITSFFVLVHWWISRASQLVQLQLETGT